MRLALVDAGTLRAQAAEHVDLLVATVDAGGGIGFLAPLARAKAEAYWAQVARDVEAGLRVLVEAREGDALLGSVQVEPATRETGLHRAEVQKLMVHPQARRTGVARTLMERAECEAAARGRTLLMLDTFEGGIADGMYRRWGWTVVGVVPNYSIRPHGGLGNLVLFCKEIGLHVRQAAAPRQEYCHVL